jgi:hypothetical protein
MRLCAARTRPRLTRTNRPFAPDAAGARGVALSPALPEPATGGSSQPRNLQAGAGPFRSVRRRPCLATPSSSNSSAKQRGRLPVPPDVVVADALHPEGEAGPFRLLTGRPIAGRPRGERARAPVALRPTIRKSRPMSRPMASENPTQEPMAIKRMSCKATTVRRK